MFIIYSAEYFEKLTKFDLVAFFISTAFASFG